MFSPRRKVGQTCERALGKRRENVRTFSPPTKFIDCHIIQTDYNTAEIIIAKQRHGPIGTVKAHFDPNFTRFSDLNIKEYDNIIE